MNKYAYPVAKTAEELERALVTNDPDHILKLIDELVTYLDAAGETDRFSDELDTLLTGIKENPGSADRVDPPTNTTVALRAIKYWFVGQLFEEPSPVDLAPLSDLEIDQEVLFEQSPWLERENQLKFTSIRTPLIEDELVARFDLDLDPAELPDTVRDLLGFILLESASMRAQLMAQLQATNREMEGMMAETQSTIQQVTDELRASREALEEEKDKHGSAEDLEKFRQSIKDALEDPDRV